MNRQGKTYYVDFKTKEYYTHLREYQDSRSQLEVLFTEANKIDSIETRWLFEELNYGNNSEEFTIECLSDLIHGNMGA